MFYTAKFTKTKLDVKMIDNEIEFIRKFQLKQCTTDKQLKKYCKR